MEVAKNLTITITTMNVLVAKVSIVVFANLQYLLFTDQSQINKANTIFILDKTKMLFNFIKAITIQDKIKMYVLVAKRK
jgi:hypothetical protein